MTDTRTQALVIHAASRIPPRPSLIDPDTGLYQRIVGGFIEAVHGETAAGERVVFYCNEDGIAQNLPVNSTATRLWHRLNPIAAQRLFGNVVVMGADGPQDADLPYGVADLARAAHHEVSVTATRRRFALSCTETLYGTRTTPFPA